MKILRKVISELPLCYCVAPLLYRDRLHFLVASENTYPCLLFDAHGKQVDKVWDTPGGTMSAVYLPGSDGVFLATHRFYSPDDAKDASIVLAKPENGAWTIHTLASLPFVHRFDILSRDGANHLLACCLKRSCEGVDDWHAPGMTLACRLPDDLAESPRPLALTELKGDMLKNHGYCRSEHSGLMTGLVSCDAGVFRFTPPAAGESNWTVEELISDAASDAIDLDLDGCGTPELLTLSPFHGDTLRVYKQINGAYRQVWEYEKKLEFCHAICRGKFGAHTAAIIGHRKGDRDLLAVYFDAGAYRVDTLDHDVGPANVLFAEVDGRSIVLAANRETSQVVYYTLDDA